MDEALSGQLAFDGETRYSATSQTGSNQQHGRAGVLAV
jgi:hypothetical protein